MPKATLWSVRPKGDKLGVKSVYLTTKLTPHSFRGEAEKKMRGEAERVAESNSVERSPEGR